MKIILSTIIASIFTFACAFAQDGSPDSRGERNQAETSQQEKSQTRKSTPTKEEILSQKIAFFTQELDLNPEEAQVFWPVYNAAYKKAETARKEINGTIRQVHNLLKDNPDVSEAEINKLMEKYFQALEEEDRIYTQAYTDLCKVLPIKKAAKTFTLEERFRIMLIKQLRRNN